jgi:LuxR family maltose regulon positive regulatory protein
MEGEPMVELLRHAASRGIEPEYTSDVLTLMRASHAPGLPMAAPQPQPLVEPLSERELDVLRLLATALSASEIAEELFISVSTVRSHTKSIYGKLNVHRRWAAVERGKELKLI